MKPLTLIVIVFCCLQTIVEAQSFTKKQDSINRIKQVKLLDSAFVLAQQSKYAESIKQTRAVLDYAKQSNDSILEAGSYIVLAFTSNVTGGGQEKSLEYLNLAQTIYENLNEDLRLIGVYNNIGAVYAQNGNVKKAKAYFFKALNRAKQSKNKDQEVMPSSNIINYLILEEKYEEAEVLTKNALEIVETTSSPIIKRGKFNLYYNMWFIYYKLNKKEESTVFFKKGIEHAEAHKLLEGLSRIYETQANFFEEDQQYEKANKMLSKYMSIRDSILKQENYKQVKEIEAKYLVKESKNKLALIESEKALQEETISKSKQYKLVLTVFSIVLLFSVFWVFKKNRALKQARDKAEYLSHAKSNFYSEISHELRTPLYAVIELSILLLNENVSAKHKEYLESLKFSGSHLMSLINNVLQINKVESGELKIQLLDFNLKNLIYNIIESLEYALRDSNNKIHLKYDDAIPKILVGDSLKLSQVFINLISNAIKFTKDGDINIIIKQLEESGETVKIHFSIADTGKGISKEKQVKIFEDFYQEETKTENIYNGTGLGLSIVKRIITAMDSTVNVDSEIDKGTTLSFNLIFEKSNTSNTPVALYGNQLEAIVDSYILVVDDNKINQLVTQKVLESLGIKNRVVDSGERAIAVVKEEHFDCILMDLHMPGLDGYETSSIIKEFKPELPIVALTAAAADEIEVKVKQFKMEGYILKPFITTEFVETLNKVIRNSIV